MKRVSGIPKEFYQAKNKIDTDEFRIAKSAGVVRSSQ